MLYRYMLSMNVRKHPLARNSRIFVEQHGNCEDILCTCDWRCKKLAIQDSIENTRDGLTRRIPWLTITCSLGRQVSKTNHCVIFMVSHHEVIRDGLYGGRSCGWVTTVVGMTSESLRSKEGHLAQRVLNWCIQSCSKWNTSAVTPRNLLVCVGLPDFQSRNTGDFYRAMHVVLARYCYRVSSVRLSVRPSVCLSVTLMYRGHIGWTIVRN